MQPKEIAFVILLSVFITCLAFINIVSAKLWTFMGLTISGGIMAYWLTFPITDVVGEVYGRERARLVVWLGFGANILVLGMSQLAIFLPPAEIYGHQSELEIVLGAVPVIVFASLTAYLCSQTHDVWAFAFWKRVTKGRHLWLRNNLSTFTSQLIDSVVFNGIAFWALAAQPVPFDHLLVMTLGYWFFKVCIAALDTPLVYILVYWIRKLDSNTQP